VLSARFGDRCLGVCSHPSHSSPITVGATIVTGSFKKFVNGLPAARVGDSVISDCGHDGVIVTGSFTVITDGMPTARFTDSVAGFFNGTIIDGSFDSLTGG
jgi:uncharacterized Zn-binding protein involved in type VI secretion